MLDEGKNSELEADRIESLRLILEHQQSRVVTQDEALEVGESLITFFELLGESLAEPTNEIVPESAG